MVKKHQIRIQVLDDKIIAMYVWGMSMQEIQRCLLELDGTELSPEFISPVTDAITDQVTAWQNAQKHLPTYHLQKIQGHPEVVLGSRLTI